MMFGSEMMMAAGGGAPDVDEVFATSLFTGTGSAQRIVNGIDNTGQGGLVWTKSRTSARHYLYDTVRGAGNSLDTSSTAASNAVTPSQFHDDGYTAGAPLNNSQVLWNFRRAPRFFDVVTYTGNGVAGRQIAHELGVKPGMIVVKRIDATASWWVQHVARGASKHLVLNSIAAESANIGSWNNTEPTETNFTVGTFVETNANGGAYVAYLFAHDPEPDGIIQCGQYLGNGSTTGPIVTLGWEPQIVLRKCAVSNSNWVVIDNQRSPSNPRTLGIHLNAGDAETSLAAYSVSITSDGFQIISSASTFNALGQASIYMAIRKGDA